MLSVAGPDLWKSPPKKMGSAVTWKRFVSTPIPSAGTEGGPQGLLGTLSASERPAVLPEWREARLGAEATSPPWAPGQAPSLPAQGCPSSP